MVVVAIVAAVVASKTKGLWWWSLWSVCVFWESVWEAAWVDSSGFPEMPRVSNSLYSIPFC